MPGEITVELAKATPAQINEMFSAQVAALAELDAEVASEGSSEERNELKAEIEKSMTELRAAYGKAQPKKSTVDTTPLTADIEDDDDTEDEDAEKADLENADDEEIEEDDDGDELTDEQIAEAAERAHKKTSAKKADAPKRTVQRAKIRKATNNLEQKSAYSDELDSPVARAKHISGNKGRNGHVLGAQMFDVSAMDAGDYLGSEDTSAQHMAVINKAHARRAAAAEADAEVRKAGVNRAGLVHKAGCGCTSCQTPINQLPEIFCNLGNEITDWFTQVPMEDGCTLTAQQLTGEEPKLKTNDWSYGCLATGEVDDNGIPIYLDETGLIVYDEEGNPTVPKPWDPNDQSTWKVANELSTLCSKDVKYALTATSIAYDISRSARLCKSAYVDRELRRGARELNKIRAIRGLNAFCTYAERANTIYTGDGSAGENFGAGLAALIADEFDALAFEHCLDLSSYTAFVINAPEKWLQMETLRSGGKVSAAGVLQECFGNVITTSCLPSGVKRPYTALGGTDGGPHALTSAACEREVTVILADNQRWIEGVGDDFTLVEDRGSRCTALGNGEFHFMEQEYTHVPTDDWAAFKMTLLLNNKGQIVEDVAPNC